MPIRAGKVYPDAACFEAAKFNNELFRKRLMPQHHDLEPFQTIEEHKHLSLIPNLSWVPIRQYMGLLFNIYQQSKLWSRVRWVDCVKKNNMHLVSETYLGTRCRKGYLLQSDNDGRVWEFFTHNSKTYIAKS